MPVDLLSSEGSLPSLRPDGRPPQVSRPSQPVDQPTDAASDPLVTLCLPEDPFTEPLSTDNDSHAEPERVVASSVQPNDPGSAV